MRNLGNIPAGLRRAQLLTLMANLDFHGIMNDLITKYNDILKFDSMNCENDNIVEDSNEPKEKPRSVKLTKMAIALTLQL